MQQLVQISDPISLKLLIRVNQSYASVIEDFAANPVEDLHNLAVNCFVATLKRFHVPCDKSLIVENYHLEIFSAHLLETRLGNVSSFGVENLCVRD